MNFNELPEEIKEHLVAVERADRSKRGDWEADSEYYMEPTRERLESLPYMKERNAFTKSNRPMFAWKEIFFEIDARCSFLNFRDLEVRDEHRGLFLLMLGFSARRALNDPEVPLWNFVTFTFYHENPHVNESVRFQIDDPHEELTPEEHDLLKGNFTAAQAVFYDMVEDGIIALRRDYEHYISDAAIRDFLADSGLEFSADGKTCDCCGKIIQIP